MISLSSEPKERLLKCERAAKVWDSKDPMWHWGDQVWGYKASLCDLALTNRRLMIVRIQDDIYTGTKTMMPVYDLAETLSAYLAEHETVSYADYSKLKIENVPLQNVLEVEGKRYWKNMSGAYYLRIKYLADNEERFKCIMFGQGFMRKTVWAEEITKAKESIQLV